MQSQAPGIVQLYAYVCFVASGDFSHTHTYTPTHTDTLHRHNKNTHFINKWWQSLKWHTSPPHAFPQPRFYYCNESTSIDLYAAEFVRLFVWVCLFLRVLFFAVILLQMMIMSNMVYIIHQYIWAMICCRWQYKKIHSTSTTWILLLWILFLIAESFCCCFQSHNAHALIYYRSIDFTAATMWHTNTFQMWIRCFLCELFIQSCEHERWTLILYLQLYLIVNGYCVSFMQYSYVPCTLMKTYYFRKENNSIFWMKPHSHWGIVRVFCW